MLKRSGFKRPQYSPPPAAPLRPVENCRGVYAGASQVAAVTRETRHRSDKWLRAVASLPCVQCGREGVQAAHRNEGKGMALKVDDALTAALCPECHSAIDSGKDMDRTERRARMDAAILLTLVQLARRGLVKPA